MLQSFFIDHRLQNSKMESEILIKSLYEQIGKLKVENDFLKKKLKLSGKSKKDLVDSNNCDLSILKQCELLELPRSSFYYKQIPESPENIRLMNCHVLNNVHIK